MEHESMAMRRYEQQGVSTNIIGLAFAVFRRNWSVPARKKAKFEGFRFIHAKQDFLHMTKFGVSGIMGDLRFCAFKSNQPSLSLKI